MRSSTVGQTCRIFSCCDYAAALALANTYRIQPLAEHWNLVLLSIKLPYCCRLWIKWIRNYFAASAFLIRQDDAYATFDKAVICLNLPLIYISGFVIGVGIGELGPDVSKYAFALAGGMFLYISLGCMVSFCQFLLFFQYYRLKLTGLCYELFRFSRTFLMLEMWVNGIPWLENSSNIDCRNLLSFCCRHSQLSVVLRIPRSCKIRQH